MKKFEYKVIYYEKIIDYTSSKDYDEQYQEYFNLLGNEGWELAGVGANHFYFKREIITNAPSSFTTKG